MMAWAILPTSAFAAALVPVGSRQWLPRHEMCGANPATRACASSMTTAPGSTSLTINAATRSVRGLDPHQFTVTVNGSNSHQPQLGDIHLNAGQQHGAGVARLDRGRTSTTPPPRCPTRPPPRCRRARPLALRCGTDHDHDGTIPRRRPPPRCRRPRPPPRCRRRPRPPRCRRDHHHGADETTTTVPTTTHHGADGPTTTVPTTTTTVPTTTPPRCRRAPPRPRPPPRCRRPPPPRHPT